MQSLPDSQRAETSTATNELAPWLASQIQKIVDDIHRKYKNVDEGAVATYIPELGKADPRAFGICLVTVEGQVFTAGDWNMEFTIQSMCKPFAFQMARTMRDGGDAQARGR